MPRSTRASSQPQEPASHPASTDMSLATRLSNVITPQTDDWVRASTREVHARLAGVVVHFDLPGSDAHEVELEDSETGPSSPVREQYSRSARSASICSSMAPALIHQSPTCYSAHPPSLRSCITEATPTETSISTGLASLFTTGVPLLEENDGVLEVPHTQARQPVFECAFWFLSCGYISRNREEWTMHCESHFRGEEPPRSVQCPLCDWQCSHGDGWMAWNYRMEHLAFEHTMMGQTLRTSRPDFGLFQHLWRKRLIDTEDLKELNGGNHNLQRPPGNFVETNGRGSRRERDERRHRRQHVPSVRRVGPQGRLPM